MKNSNSIFLSLGSNIGDKKNNLIDAVRLISNFAKILKISSVYKSEPLLFEEQDDFFNIVIEIDYQQTARNLLLKIKDIETQMGRKENFRYGPRLIDIDIIFFKGEEINEKDLDKALIELSNAREILNSKNQNFSFLKEIINLRMANIFIVLEDLESAKKVNLLINMVIK